MENVETRKKRIKDRFREIAGEMIFALALVGIISSFIGIIVVSGFSMYPTYDNGDVVVYYAKQKPKNGDVVIISGTKEQFGREEDVIKRIIAGSGQTICAVGGKVYVDDCILHEEYLKEEVVTNDFEEILVPEGEFFMMGDNRGSSNDSRMVVNLGVILNVLFFLGILIFVGSLHMHQLAVIFVKQPWLIFGVFAEVVLRMVMRKYKKSNTYEIL